MRLLNLQTVSVHSSLIAVALACWPFASRLTAQEPAPAAAPAAVAPGAKPAPKKDEVYRPEQEDLVVNMVMEAKPSTPQQLLRSIELLIDLRRAPLARPFVKQLQAANLDDDTRYSLAESFGSAVLLRIGSNADLAPEGGQLSDAILAGADKVRSDPQRLAKLVRGLSDPAPLVRQQSLADLTRAHGAAVAPLVLALADPQRKGEHPIVRDMLVRLGPEAADPLVGVLEAPDQALQAEAADLLGQLGVKSVVPQLAARAVSDSSSEALRQAASRALERIVGAPPSTGEVQVYLKREIERQLERSRLAASGSEATVEVWRWDNAKRRSVPSQLKPAEAALAIASRLADDLRNIDRDDPIGRRLYLMTLLEAAQQQAGLDQPLPIGEGSPFAIAASFGPDVIDDLLVGAIALRQIPAAIAAAQVLGEIGSFKLVARSGPAASPLVQAIEQGDPRLRFAAMNAILKIDPTEPFAGSSSVTDTLAYFVGASGPPRALIGHPRTEQGQQLAGLLAALGYEADLATNSRKAFELATIVPDYDFAMLHRSLDRPPVDELVKQLRKDSRTRRLPIGLVATLEELTTVGNFTRQVPLCEAFARAHSVEAVKIQVEQLVSHLGRSRLAIEERKRQSAAALDWVVELTQKPHRVFDLSRTVPAVQKALLIPELTPPAVAALASLGYPRSQRLLLDTANHLTQPLSVRQAAAAAFEKNVARSGVLLTTSEIVQQYDHYNASEKQDRETQEVLASILDSIEARKRSQLPKSAEDEEK